MPKKNIKLKNFLVGPCDLDKNLLTFKKTEKSFKIIFCKVRRTNGGGGAIYGTVGFHKLVLQKLPANVKIKLYALSYFQSTIYLLIKI